MNDGLRVFLLPFFFFFFLCCCVPGCRVAVTQHLTLLHFPEKPLSPSSSPPPAVRWAKNRTSRARGNPLGTAPSPASIPPAPLGCQGLIPILLLHHFQVQFPAFPFPCPRLGDSGMLQAGAEGGRAAGWPGKGRSQPFLTSLCLSFPGFSPLHASVSLAVKWR